MRHLLPAPSRKIGGSSTTGGFIVKVTFTDAKSRHRR
jgi:hypothetical protein